MQVISERLETGLTDNLLMLGIGLSGVYWVLEAALHVLLFKEDGFLSHLFVPGPHELWMRCLVVGLIILFSIYGQTILNERKRIARALIRSEREAKRILENNPACILLVDTETRQISWANTNALNLLQSTADELSGRMCHRHLCPSEMGNCPVLDHGKEIDRSERLLRAADGRQIPILKSVARVKFKDRDHLLEAFFDISEQKQMQQAIRLAHAELNQIFQTAAVGMRLIDRDYNLLKVNRTFSTLSGVDEEAAIGKKCYEVFAGPKCHTPGCPLRLILNGQEPSEYEVQKVRADGTVIPCILRATPFTGPEGQILGIVESFQDITELNAAQEELTSERDKLHRILFQQLEGVAIVNPDFTVEYENEVFAETFGRSVGTPCYAVLRKTKAPCDPCYMRRSISGGTIQRCEFDAEDGTVLEHTYTPFTDNDAVKKTVVSVKDITEKKASVLAAIHSDRLAAIGELAAGVAHEINNPVNGIINYAQMVANRTEEGNHLNRISHRIIKEGFRIARIVQSLLSFARQEEDARVPADVGALLADSLTLTGTQLRKDGIDLSLEIATSLPPVEVNPQQVQQVFVNLISNARFALNDKINGHSGEKSLRIATTVARENGDAFVRTSFRDTGTGIARELLDKVMNPFFSTKPRGEGTGLGLSISHGIVNKHGGHIRVESVEGEYTHIHVDLPVFDTGEKRAQQ